MKIRTIISTLIVCLGILISYNLYKDFYKEEKETILENKSVQNATGLPMALMVETDIDTNIYEPWDNDDWPGAGYTFNQEKSKCENGGTLEWTGSSVLLKTNTSDKCYAYFDAPLKISTIEDLVNFSTSVNNGKTYENEYVVLMNNLDFNNPSNYQSGVINQDLVSGNGFTPIGYSHLKPFKGSFDGNNNQISSIFVNIIKNTTGSAVYAGLFGYGVNASIKNLTVSGEVKSSITADTAGIIARLDGGNIDNVHNKINVYKNTGTTSLNQTGGIIGYVIANINIINSTNDGSVQNGGGVGGIIGTIGANANIFISDCINMGDITNTLGHIAGGIIGNLSNQSSNISIEKSVNKGKVFINGNHSNNVYAGGMVGYSNSILKIDNSQNFGEIVSDTENEIPVRLGGIVGYATKELTVNNSYNNGVIKNEKLNFSKFIQINLGGIVGSGNTANIKISNSYNASDILNGTYSAGIIGYNFAGEITIDKCYNTGTINDSMVTFDNGSTASVCGGIMGYTSGTSTTGDNVLQIANVINSYNAGNVVAFSLTGSIVGHSNMRNNINIINSYNIADVSSVKDIANGITEFGYYGYKLQINNVYNLGNLDGKMNNNGIDYVDTNTIIDYSVKNAYYKNQNANGLSISGSNISNDKNVTTSLAESAMKNQNFVDTLNDNLASINLQDIDPSLEGYTLSKWVEGTDGYPIFEYQK